MNISAVTNSVSSNNASATSSSSSDTSLKTLESQEQNLETEINQLTKNGADNNSAEVKQLQQQLSVVENEITESESSSTSTSTSTTSSSQGVGPAFTVRLSGSAPQISAVTASKAVK